MKLLQITIRSSVDPQSIHAAVLTQLIHRICSDFAVGDEDVDLPPMEITLVVEAVDVMSVHSHQSLIEIHENQETEQNDN